MRAKYWVPFRTDVAPKDPVSIMGKAQGTPFCPGEGPQPLPAAVPKTVCAVEETVALPMPDGRYFAITDVPTVLAVARFACAKAMNWGSTKFTDPPALEDERSGSTAK